MSTSASIASPDLGVPVSRLAEAVTPVVVAKDATYAYPDGTVAIEGLSLEIPPGLVVAIVGPSGCGKSTFLQMAAGLLSPTAGTVSTSVDTAHGACPMTMMFQTDTTLPWLTVLQNVLLYTRFKRWRPSRSQRPGAIDAANELIDMVGLKGFEKHYPYQLSGGMKRRLAFATSVMPRPRLLLLDEPFSSVDEPTRVRIHQDVFDITRSLGLTVLLVTHDLAEAITLSDEVHILTRRPGRLHATFKIPFGTERTMVELRDRPQFLELYGELWHSLSSQL